MIVAQRVHRGHILGTAFAVMPPLAVVAPLGAAPLLAVLAAALAAWSAAHRRWPAPQRAMALTLGAFLGWALLSAIWADDPGAALRAWPPIALAAAAGMYAISLGRDLSAAERRMAEAALATGFAVALALLALECLSRLAFERSAAALFFVRKEYEPQVFNRSLALLALLAWPAASVVWRRSRVGAFALIVAMLLLAPQYESMAAIAAVALGAIVFVVAWRAPRGTAAVLAILVVLGIAATPVVPRLPEIAAISERRDLSMSVYHRMAIWTFAAKAVAERPILGRGLDASRDLAGGEAQIGPRLELLPLHPHNAVLQWWLELGAVGAALGAVLILLAIRAAATLGGANAAAALALTAAALTIATLGYGIWQGWWMSGLWLAAAVMASIAARPSQPDANCAKRGRHVTLDPAVP